MTSAEIGTSGEQHVMADLTAKGWYCRLNTRFPGATDIEATKGTQAMLVQVKTAAYPNVPDVLSYEEWTDIRKRAERLGWQPWLAQVQIDRFGAMIGEVKYTPAR